MVIPGSLLFFAFFWLLVVLSYLAKRGFGAIMGLVTTLAVLFALASADFPVLLGIVIFAAIAGTCHGYRLRFLRFLGGSAVVMGAAVACATPRWLEVSELVQRYPRESLRVRLLPRSHQASANMTKENVSVVPVALDISRADATEATAISTDISKHLAAVEEALQREQRHHRGRDRSLATLDRLHETAIKVFEDTPGLGVQRIRSMPIRKQLIDLPEFVPIPMPSPTPNELLTADVAAREPWTDLLPTGSSIERLLGVHVDSVANFANPSGFGYIPWSGSNRRDLDHVVGFQPHGFRSMPKLWDESASATWEVERLDLVSLLLNDPPAVYVTENLPQMNELRVAPTRPLLDFETASLERLRRGEALATSSTTNAIRMFGAVRATKSCLECHDTREGTMLGAFSYVLRRQGRLPSPPPRVHTPEPLS